MIAALAACFALLTSAVPAHAHCDPTTDPDKSDIASARAAVAGSCDCAGTLTHGEYVSCAAQQANAILTNKDCARSVKRCASRSTCGKPDAVTCCRMTTKGSKCHIRKNAARCIATHGTVGSCTSCCDAPGCGQLLTKITTGDIVTTPATYWRAAWGDFDDDGYLDLFVGGSFVSETNFLYHNNRDGTFTLVDAAHMPKIPSSQRGVAWGDYDNDGHLDLIVTAGNPEILHNVLYRNNGDGTFSSITTGPIYADTSSAGFNAPAWGDYNNDGFIDLFIAGNTGTRLFRNNGDGSFAGITSSVLVSDPGESEGLAWVDYDNDGDGDLFVSNNAPVRSLLYRNDGHEVFTSVADSGLTSRVDDTIGCCWGDYDNDGFPDLFLANAHTNSLYRNNGDGTFTSITDSTVVTNANPSEAVPVSCAWGDYDNDGFIDLFVTVADDCSTICCNCSGYNGPPRGHNLLYHNNGDGAFTRVTEGSVVTDLTTECPNGSWGDYDNDGFLDLFVSQGGYTPNPQNNLLYHNNGNSNAWLNVKLVGTVSNRSAIGAKVRVRAFYRGATRWQLRELFGDQQSLNAEFGLADATNIDTVRVEWPSGIVQELHDVPPRQFLTITEAPWSSPHFLIR